MLNVTTIKEYAYSLGFDMARITSAEAFPEAERVLQERIAQARLLSDPPEVLLTPRLGQLGPFEYHRAAMAIKEGRGAVAEMLPALQGALSV